MTPISPDLDVKKHSKAVGGDENIKQIQNRRGKSQSISSQLQFGGGFLNVQNKKIRTRQWHGVVKSYGEFNSSVTATNYGSNIAVLRMKPRYRVNTANANNGQHIHTSTTPLEQSRVGERFYLTSSLVMNGEPS